MDDSPHPPDDLTDLAVDLVRVPTENPPGDERPGAEFVADWFAEQGIDARLVESPDPDRPQVVAWVGDDPRDAELDTPTLVLNGHLDVVPAGDPDEWSRDPFGGVVEEGVLYGRGSADMKTGLAVAMLTLRDLAPEIGDEAGTLDGSLVFHAAMGEETGAPGTRMLLEEGYGGDMAVVLEPTNFRVGTSAKGVVTYRVGVSGSASHASRPDQGVNAIDAARPLLAGIEDYDDRLREREDSLVGRAYATVTEFEAGTDSNMAVLPGRAELLLDRRILPGETFEEVEDEIEALLAEVERDSGVETDLTLVKHYSSAGIPADSPLAERFRTLSAEMADAPREPWGLEAATDAREFVARGTPAIIWGPGELAQAHTVDEHIDLRDAGVGLAILKRAVRGILSG
ncbi:M20 family metallopeptidase [Halorussus lipolyticus]|uniref:M20 family metallopeptidase n=1 Tax=Halorussus lipolyticus TaxID=3034024 RepID=UPI0023E8C214|nr:M20 family metallopeptidase [Halorussus sp. DT80]